MIGHDPRHYPAAIKECWCVHQAMRQLGFAADDIYVAIGKDAARPEVAVALFVVLRTQGKEFVVTLDGYSSEEAAEEALSQWTAFVSVANEGGFEQALLDDIYQASHIMQNKEQFVVALFGKGIRPAQEWS